MKLTLKSMVFLLAAVYAAFLIPGSVGFAAVECRTEGQYDRWGEWVLVEVCDRPTKTEEHAPAPLPEPGVAGNLRVVRAWVTKEVQQGADGRYQSVIVTATDAGTQYKTMMAFTLVESPAPGSLRPELACGEGNPFVLPPPLGWDKFPQTGSEMKAMLATGRYVQLDRLDLSFVPNPNKTPGSWNHQPTWGELERAGVIGPVPVDKNAHVPGILHVNLVLITDPGDTKWRIQSWQYIFEVDAKIEAFLDDCFEQPPVCDDENGACGPADGGGGGWDWSPPGSPSPMPTQCVPKDGWDWLTRCNPPRKAIIR